MFTCWKKNFATLTVGLLLVLMNIYTLDAAYKCVHDSVSDTNVPVGTLTSKQMKGRQYRHAVEFESLHIHYHLDDMDPSISISEAAVYNIEMALQRVVKFFLKTLKVRMSVNPFFLERSSCSKRWSTGPNLFRCSKLKNTSEYCSLKETEYLIPSHYLNRLEVYDFLGVAPHTVLKEGIGLPNRNFVLFVISRSTSWCSNEGVQAYGSFCRLDSSMRPVAGLLNLCPDKFLKDLYAPDYYYNVIMHEVIHILGFSRSLFSSFKTCKSPYNCRFPKKIIQTDKNSLERIVLPEVVESMKLHFNCSKSDFGAPLEKAESSGGSNYSKGSVSHWHPLLMYTSIMTPAFSEDDYVVVDNITLSLLAGTGWYQVQFPENDTFILGKGGGCEFGFEDSCEKSENLCQPSDELTACDILHYTVGQCEKVVPYHPCGVFKPNTKKSCLVKEGRVYELSLKALQHEKRCVMMQETNQSATPSCVVVKCKARKEYDVLVNDEWADCENETVTVNHTKVICPNHNLVCPIELGEEKKGVCNRDGNLTAIVIRMFFTGLTFDDLVRTQNFKNFKVSIVRSIASKIDIPVNYIFNTTLNVFKEISLDLVICPPLEIGNSELHGIVERTQEFLKSSMFASILEAHENFPVATSDIQIEPDVAVEFSDYEGFVTLIVVPALCAIFILASIMASSIRLAMIQKHRPKRETVEMEESNVNDPTDQNSDKKLAD